MPRDSRLSVLIAAAIATLAAAAFADPGYLMYPDLHGDRVVFQAERDLWVVSDGGGMAKRLTTHGGSEYFPRFSPDGEWIAFSGHYDGNADVYIVSSEGGEPRRLTWHPMWDDVICWSADGSEVIFRTMRDHPRYAYELYAVSVEGGDARKLPLGWAARLDIEPETGVWAFNRRSRDGRTWKRYRGGTATGIWVGDPVKQDYRQITHFDGMDAHPMWHGGRVYFLSDQGGTANIWSVLPDGSDRRRHTEHGEWDARYPGMGPDGRIAYMLAGGLRVFDPVSQTDVELQADLPSERILTRNRYPHGPGYLTWYTISPEADRLLVTTRGEIFSVPVEDGVTLPVKSGSGGRERYGSFDPEGEKIAYVTDASGEEAIEVIDAWGRGEPTVLKPAGKSGWHMPPTYSPDGRWLAFADQTWRLYVVPTSGGKPTLVDRGEQWEIRDYVWSPDGRWLAYTKPLRNHFSSIYLYDTQEKAVHEVTGPNTWDASPAWDPDGRYLYFLSDRYMNPILGWRDFEFVETASTKPYLVLLREDVANPFARREGLPPDEDAEDEEDDEEEGEKDEDEDDEDEDEDEIEPVDIDLEGIGQRIMEFPVDAGIYYGMEARSEKVFYMSVPVLGMVAAQDWYSEPRRTIVAFDLEEKEAETFLSGVSGFDLAQKADKMVVMKKDGEFYVVGTDGPPGDDLGESSVNLGDVVVELDPDEEWRQIYHESWRHMRDFYWDESMGGVDWQAERDKYASLLPLVATRDDVRDLVGELIGELATSHTYVWGGDYGVHVFGVSVGLLGCDVEREGDAYRVTRIYYGDPPDNELSPLRAPGVDIGVGDYILAVNHRPFAPNQAFYSNFEGLADKQVLLTVNDKASEKGSRPVLVATRPDDRGLRYADWVRRNREYVAEKTDGKIGYIHLPDTGTWGMVEFATWFYPQLDKQGMVVDNRWNGGGFTSQLFVSRLQRTLVASFRSRHGRVGRWPSATLNGPFVVVTNQFAGSDGDIFPRAVQLLGLAPVIGMRSWGGVVGIRNDKRLVDGGVLTEPEFAWWNPTDGWEVENRGVEPDIEVDNLPQELAAGLDAQLDRGIEEVLRLLEEHPGVPLEFGPAKDRSRRAFLGELE